MTLEDKTEEQSPKFNNGNRQQLDIPEIAALGPDEKNWRGIGIALVVITSVCALIVAAVLLLTPGDKGNPIGKNKITLKSIINGDFSVKSFNGTWISDDEFIYLTLNKSIEIYNVPNNSRQVIMPSAIVTQHTISSFDLSPDKNYILLTTNYRKVYRYSGEAVYLVYDINNGKVVPLLPEGPNSKLTKLQYAGWGKIGNQLAYIKKNNIYYMSSVNAEPRQLTDSGVEDIVFNGRPDWVYEEEVLFKSNAIWWSNDGKKLCYASFNDTEVNEMKYPQYGSFRDNKNVYPKIISLRYPKPGRKNPTISLWVVDLTAQTDSVKVTPPSEYRDVDHYFTRANWIGNDALFVIWLKRAQNVSTISVCKEEGSWNCEEKHRLDTHGHGWIDDLTAPKFTPDNEYCFILLPGPPEGDAGPFNHVAMISLKTKKVNFLTRGKYDVAKIVAYKPNKKTLFYISSMEDKPSERHLFSVTDMTSEIPLQVTCLTCDLGPKCLSNNAVFSKDSSYYALNCLGPGIPYSEIKSPKFSSPLLILENNKQTRELVSKTAMPQVKHMRVPLPGNYMANVKLLLPPKLSESEITKYPMLVEVYAGPGSQMVTELFNIGWGSYLASSRNIIHAVIDGRGSAFQGLKMRWEMYRRLGTVEIQDQILVAKYLRDNLPYIDEKKISIFGWSYGGYAAAMVLANDSEKVFSCGISVAPVTNWLYYDSIYTERYMQMPTENDNLKSYEDSDLMSKVKNLKGKRYFLIHGTGDDNVHWFQSAMLSKALAEEGIIFRMQVYPDETHALLFVRLHLYRMIDEFLDQSFRDETSSDDT